MPGQAELSLRWCWRTSATCHHHASSPDTAATPGGLTLRLSSLLSSQGRGLSTMLALKKVTFPLNPWKTFFFFFTISPTITSWQKLYEYVKDKYLLFRGGLSTLGVAGTLWTVLWWIIMTTAYFLTCFSLSSLPICWHREQAAGALDSLTVVWA